MSNIQTYDKMKMMTVRHAVLSFPEAIKEGLTLDLVETSMIIGAEVKPNVCQLIAETILEAWPTEHLEDIKLAIQKGRAGLYGKVYGNKISAPLVGEWIQKRAEERAIMREKEHHNRKNDEYVIPEVDYEAYKKNLDQMDKKNQRPKRKPMTEAEFEELHAWAVEFDKQNGITHEKTQNAKAKEQDLGKVPQTKEGDNN
jgi:hypothetical protein